MNFLSTDKLLEKYYNTYTHDKFDMYYNLLVEFNNRFNLTTIISKNEVKNKHFADSLYGVDLIKGGNVLDIGAGAGFPSIPLAIVNSDKQFTLVETANKKAEFLKLVVKELELKNVKIIKNRIEQLDKNTKYDTIVARALAPLNTLLEYSLPYLKIGGILLAYKGSNYLDELNESKNALKVLGASVNDVLKYNLQHGDELIVRYFLIVEKLLETDLKYPRSGNKPRLKPL